MSTYRKILQSITVAAVLLSFSACGGKASSDTSKPLTIVADAVPHTDILKKTEELGLLGKTKLKIVPITVNIDVNQQVADGDFDANFFQHVPYLNDWNKTHNQDLVPLTKVHIEPLGLYSKKIKKLKEIPNGATIAIPNDATNQGRGLFLLVDAGLIKLNVKATDKNLNISQVTQKNIVDNPKNIKFVEIERPQLANTLDDPKVTLSIINGNYALEAGLVPSKDALTIEGDSAKPYANVLVVKPKLKDDPRVKKLAEALSSEKIKQFIKDKYQGSVLPAN